jgi:hypothetical protein
MQIIITPDRHGRFAVTCEGRELIASARTPLFDAARKLLALGHSPDTTLEMLHAGSTMVAMRGRIGKLAKLMVRENDAKGPTIGLWKPFPVPPGDQGTGKNG